MKCVFFLFCFNFQCLIDLKRNLLVIGTTGTETPFLSENELPDCARLSGPRSEVESSSAVEMEDRELAKVIIPIFFTVHEIL